MWGSDLIGIGLQKIIVVLVCINEVPALRSVGQSVQVSRIVVIAVTGEGSDVVWLST